MVRWHKVLRGSRGGCPQVWLSLWCVIAALRAQEHKGQQSAQVHAGAGASSCEVGGAATPKGAFAALTSLCRSELRLRTDSHRAAASRPVCAQ
eukprot:scaffold2376_cov115-Isochrysis_galbana.AAC.13